MWVDPRFVFALVAPGVAFLAVACLGPVPDLYPPKPGEVTVTIYVVGHGWHTGIVMRRHDIPTEAWPEHSRFPTARFLEVAWGDDAFYRSPNPGVVLAVKAALDSEASVLHVAGFDQAPAAQFPSAEIIAVDLSERGLETLARFVSRAYARDAAGQPIELGPGLYPGSRFYAATGRYSLFNTCNRWIAEALRAAGCPITPVWAVTAGNLLAQAAECGHAIRP